MGAALAATMAAAPNDAQMAPLQYLVGTWNCTWHSGGHSGTLDQIFSPALGGAWLEEKEVVTAGGRQTVTSLHYTGYDPQTKEYVHVGPDADGSYEIAHSPDAQVWNNADGTFVHRRVTGDERTMSETARLGRKTVHSVMTCKRATT
jgi:hypothetical protein